MKAAGRVTLCVTLIHAGTTTGGGSEQRGQVALEALVGQYSMRLGLQSDGVPTKPLKEIAVELAKAAAEKLR